jgi:hypothetical protein
MRIQKATVPGARDFKPGDEVEVEVMAAGGTTCKQQRSCGERGT